MNHEVQRKDRATPRVGPRDMKRSFAHGTPNIEAVQTLAPNNLIHCVGVSTRVRVYLLVKPKRLCNRGIHVRIDTLWCYHWHRWHRYESPRVQSRILPCNNAGIAKHVELAL